MIRRSLRRRSGFALMLVMTAIVLLLIFLLAAQGSVAVSHLQMKRSADKMDAAERDSLLLSGARRKLGKSPSNEPKELTPVGAPETPIADGVECLVRRLDPGDAVYGELPSLAHRDGDGLALVKESGKGFSRETRYLINGAGNRPGAIRIPPSAPPSPAPKPAKPAQGAKP